MIYLLNRQHNIFKNDTCLPGIVHKKTFLQGARRKGFLQVCPAFAGYLKFAYTFYICKPDAGHQ
jgi:hypothetical protein